PAEQPSMRSCAAGVHRHESICSAGQKAVQRLSLLRLEPWRRIAASAQTAQESTIDDRKGGGTVGQCPPVSRAGFKYRGKAECPDHLPERSDALLANALGIDLSETIQARLEQLEDFGMGLRRCQPQYQLRKS